MNCPQIQKLLQAHHDGELDAANTLLVDEHLADCPHCFAQLRQLSALRGALQNDTLRFAAPAALRASIRAAVEQTAETERAAVPTTAGWSRYLGWAVAAVLTAALIVSHLQPARSDHDLTAELTSSHVRSLMASHLTDVTSTDQHTVKPWFDGKIDFAPPVRDFKDAGFPLLGGRLDFIDGRPTAALVYGRQKHLLNLFIWPATSSAPQNPTTTQRHGYNLVQWSDGKMNFGVVSDLNPVELRDFVGLWTPK